MKSEEARRDSELRPSDCQTTRDISEHIARLADGWASVIRCKAEDFGMWPCNEIVLIVFRDFQRISSGDEVESWDSGEPILCERCAAKLDAD